MRLLTQTQVLVLAMGLGLVGCANNATMDGELMLPARPAEFDELHMVLAVRRDDSFAQVWDGTNLPMVVELGDAPQPYNFSLVTDEFTDNVFVKLRFCRTPNCQALNCTAEECGVRRRADPQAEMWIELERPFYLAQLTRWEFDLTRLPLCEDETCASITDPSDASDGPVVRGCAIDNTLPPVWRCDVGRCEIACAAVVGDAVGGSCQGGFTGPHFCE